MSLPDAVRPYRPTLRRLLPLLAMGALLTAGCTVRPLYSSAGDSTASVPGQSAGLHAINIPPVNTRYGQEVRNNLIFLFNSGAGQPGSPLYTMNLTVSEINEDTNVVSVPNQSRATAATLRLYGTYTLIDSAGNTVAKGSRDVFSSYDRPTQEFAVARARRDAEDRAARELAELLRLDAGQKLAKISG